MLSNLLEAPSLSEEQNASNEDGPGFSIDISSLMNLSNLQGQSPRKPQEKKRRHRISLETKKAIIDMHDAKLPLKVISAKYGLTKSTISSVVNQRKIVEQAWTLGRQGKSSKLRKGKYPEVEQGILDWISAEREKDPEVQFPGLLIQEKATEIAKNLNVDFQASNGWLQRFKTRFRVFFKNGTLNREIDPDLAQKPELSSVPLRKRKVDETEASYSSEELLISKWLREFKESSDSVVEIKSEPITMEELFDDPAETSDGPEKEVQDKATATIETRTETEVLDKDKKPQLAVKICESTPLPNDQLVLEQIEVPNLIEAIKACDVLSRYLQSRPTGNSRAFQLLLALEREIVQSL
ncbi:unnamed protein product [Bursaphelenchus xylophilus]|uniref:(pine wood nematode) hypothetical protein n=1 Tax=Bursaphelenchus xylophilus TaxID=6326 RepID=A0A1I7RP75_BURXY|nr:unnamed protein product [Bursaphelenchus xylophilus]CAG9124638.1 unnamed protein product [Bursaphelenchus xylophilus]